MIIGIDARVLQTKPRTGVGTFTYELLEYLFEKKPEHEYILFSNKWKSPNELPFQSYEHVRWVTTRVPNKLFHASIVLFGFPKLDRVVAKRAGIKQIDAWYSPNILFTSLSKHIPYILTIHDLSFLHYPLMYSKKGRFWHQFVRPRRQARRANAIITPSHHTKRDIETVYDVPAEKIHILYPGICSRDASELNHSIDSVKKRYRLPERFFLFLGTLEERKNIVGVLEAYNRSSYLKKHIPIVFAGALGHKGNKYMNLIEQTDNATYIGYVDEKDKDALYTLAHAFVYPSLYEGFGLPVLEAMTCGTPAIVSHRTSLPEVVGEAGVYVNPQNIASLQRAMECIVHDTSLYRSMKEKAQKQAATFSWKHSAEVFSKSIMKI